MPAGGTASSPDNYLVYSIQRTYIINFVFKPDNLLLACDERIDIPTIEPVTNVQTVVYGALQTVVPCVELRMIGVSLEDINLLFETNEGATVLPIKIDSGRQLPMKNPYSDERWVLALPRGTTGIKSCKALLGENGDTIQHNFTFGIMPPPYNYDNALFGDLSYRAKSNFDRINDLETKTGNLKIVTHALGATFPRKELVKNSGKQTVNIEKGMLYFWANYDYLPAGGSVPSTHSPKITVSDGTMRTTCTLTLDKLSQTVLIDLLAGTITAYVRSTGEIVQQRKIFSTIVGYKTIEFEDFDDIASNTLTVLITGRGVK